MQLNHLVNKSYSIITNQLEYVAQEYPESKKLAINFHEPYLYFK